MELDDRALPLTRGQLDIWLAQETSQSSTEWQLGVLVRFDGAVKRDLLEQAIVCKIPQGDLTPDQLRGIGRRAGEERQQGHRLRPPPRLDLARSGGIRPWWPA